MYCISYRKSSGKPHKKVYKKVPRKLKKSKENVECSCTVLQSWVYWAQTNVCCSCQVCYVPWICIRYIGLKKICLIFRPIVSLDIDNRYLFLTWTQLLFKNFLQVITIYVHGLSPVIVTWSFLEVCSIRIKLPCAKHWNFDECYVGTLNFEISD